uniref:Uncharacterized protein n=1 Tax=Acrobeloides nanus TaxID=290746 RepID=A0A914EKK0_9BILA
MDDNEKRRENEKSETTYISNKLWSRSETRLWTINFFMGTCVLYASRVALPICATIMAQEYGWNKSDSIVQIVY